MPYHAVFVDAGYLLVQGAHQISGMEARRYQVNVDFRSLVSGLSKHMLKLYPESDLLRIYWYDGTLRGSRTAEHEAIARIPGVKVRLGRNDDQGRQQGVDTLLVRDLIVLAQERSIARAVVVSGDSDMLEGVEYAQERGVLVTLLGVRDKTGTSQSSELKDAADALEVVPEELVTASFKPRQPKPNRTGPAARPVATQPGTPTGDDPEAALNQLGSELLQMWLPLAKAPDFDTAILTRGQLPKDLDGQLLATINARLGSASANDMDLRRRMRNSLAADLLQGLSALDPSG